MQDTIETLERVIKRIEELQSGDRDLPNNVLLNVVRDDLRSIRNGLMSGQIVTEQDYEAVKYTLACLVQHCQYAILQQLNNKGSDTVKMTSLN